MSPRIVDKDLRRRGILTAAASVFAKHGYRRATMEQIAEEAGVAKGSVYLAFASKEDLFYALFEDMAQGALAGTESGGEDTSVGVVQQLEGMLLRVADIANDNAALIPLMLEFWAVSGVEATRERFGRKQAELFAVFQGAVAGTIEAGKARGEVATEVPSAAIASALLALVDGLFIQQWTVPGITVAGTLRQALPVLLQGVGRPPAPRS